MPHLGFFYVKASPDDASTLRAAQVGCAVVRCEYMAYLDAYHVIAHHPDFDVIAQRSQPPEYECVFSLAVGGIVVRRFKKKT